MADIPTCDACTTASGGGSPSRRARATCPPHSAQIVHREVHHATKYQRTSVDSVRLTPLPRHIKPLTPPVCSGTQNATEDSVDLTRHAENLRVRVAGMEEEEDVLDSTLSGEYKVEG